MSLASHSRVAVLAACASSFVAIACGNSGSPQGSTCSTTEACTDAIAPGDAQGGSSSGADAPSGNDATSGPDSAANREAGAEAGPSASGSVLMMHNHPNRDGAFVDPALTKAALMGKTLKLDTSFDGTSVMGNVFASPLYVANGPNGKGTFYVATASNNVHAIDEATGGKVWALPAGTPAGQTGGGCGNLGGSIGITGTPAIDEASRLIVFDAASAATMGGVVQTHTIHAWSIDDGHEVWNLDVSTISDPVVGNFLASFEQQRSAVLIAGGVAYVTWSGYWGDCGTYHGWIVGVSLSGPTGAKEYATPANLCGMWGAGGPSTDGTSIFVATGNGDTLAGNAWGGAFSVLKFAAGPTFAGGSANYWHSVNDNGDVDLGGSMPLVVDAPGLTPSSLLVQLGKDGYAYLIDRSNLGGEMSPVSTAQVMNDEISNAAAWVTIPSGTYIAMVGNNGGGGSNCPQGTSGDLVVVKLDPAAPNKVTTVWCTDNQGGGSPSISTSDGSNDALVWTMGTDRGWGGSQSNQLHAWDLETGTPIVVGSDMAPNTRHFSAPIVVNGRVFVTGDNRLYAFKR